MNVTEDQIHAADAALDESLRIACRAMNLAHELRREVIDPNMKRRGWGLDPEQERLLKLLCAIKHHATEQGGGTTTDEQHALDAALECF